MLTYRLFHGRSSKDEELIDWGSEGPELTGVTGFSTTYQSTFRVHFDTEVNFRAAAAATGWNTWDHLSLEVCYDDDMVRTNGPEGYRWYGDTHLYLTPQGAETILPESPPNPSI